MRFLVDAQLPRAFAAWLSQQGHDALTVGAQIEPILRDAQVTTLASIRVLDVHGTIVATTGGDLGLSMAALPEAQHALAGEYVSLMRQRGTQRPPPPLDSISRGPRIRVAVAMAVAVAVAVPILVGDRVIGAVTLLRTPGNIWQALCGKRRELAWAGAALLLTVLGLSLLTAVTIGRPVRAVTRRARRAANLVRWCHSSIQGRGTSPSCRTTWRRWRAPWKNAHATSAISPPMYRTSSRRH